MLLNKEYYHDLIARFGLPEMPIEKVALKNPNTNENLIYKDKFKIVKQFIKYTAINNISELISLDIDFNNITKMKDGIIPNNLSIYTKIPSEYGGKLEFTNMFIIKYQFKSILDKFIQTQIINYNKELNNKNNYMEYPKELYIPNPKSTIFITALSSFSGPGGNTSTDKMSEIGSTMFLKNNGRF